MHTCPIATTAFSMAYEWFPAALDDALSSASASSLLFEDDEEDADDAKIGEFFKV